ncbi:hypothetical protein PMAYCL1PPCAC_30826, partial [Pristionchus mayeri]
ESGTDPPIIVPLREVKLEPMDADDFPDEANPLAENDSYEMSDSSRRKSVVVKEEIKDDDYEDQESEENPNEQIYCFCQKRGCTDFMIACEYCDVWFHDTCVRIDVQMSAHIVHYYCDSCVEKHGVKVVYKNTFDNFMKKRKNAVKAAETRKMKKDLEMALKNSLLIDVKEEPVDEKEYEPRAPRCSECINCAAVKNCGQCHYCQHDVGRCIKVHCFTEVAEKAKSAQKQEPITISTTTTPLVSPKLSPKGSAKRKTQRKRKSGDSDDDELFFSESTSTRKMIKKELSYKEEQQLVDVEVGEKKKRGRKKGWRKSVDGKEGKEAPEGEEAKDPKKAKKKSPKKEIKGKEIQPEKENAPENAPERPGYDASFKERLDLASSTYAHFQEEMGQLTEIKKGKCSNEGCEKDRRHQDNYCSAECGMKVAQAKLQKSGFLSKPMAYPPKARRKYVRKPKKTQQEMEEERKLEAISAWQEADFQRRKKEAEKERAKDNFVAPEGADLIQATLLRMKADAEKAKEEEQEKERKKKEQQDAELLEKKRAEADANYAKLTSYMPVSANAALSNAMHSLLSHPIIRPIPLYPLLSPLYHQLMFSSPAPYGLPPSFPAPLFPNLLTAMRDHNDYLLDPILPFSQQNSPPATNSTPSTLSTASPAAFSMSPAVPAASVSFAVPAPPVVVPAPLAVNPPISATDIDLLMGISKSLGLNPLLAAALNATRQQ